MGQLPRGGLDIASAHEVSLYRAVDPREAQDIEEFGGFRLHSSFGYEGGKWFAARFEVAVRWGRAMQRFPRPQPFRVVAVSLLAALCGGIVFHDLWDVIGPA